MNDGTISAQFDSDHAARRLFHGLLEGPYLIRKFNDPDFFIDYHLELRTRSEPTGKGAFAQLKGQSCPGADLEFRKVQFERKALRYYLNSADQVVFIVLADLKANKAYYLFAQRWISENQSSLKLSKKGRVSVPVPLSNDLSDISKFTQAFHQARQFMRDRYPGRPEAAILAAEKEYRDLDPRCDVSIVASGSGRRITISPREPFSVNFHVTPADGLKSSEIASALKYGVPGILKDVEIFANGSPLFEKLFQGKFVEMSWVPAKAEDCLLELIDAKDGTSLLSLPAKLSAGSQGFGVTAEPVDCPLSFRLLFDRNKSGQPDGGDGRLSVKYSTEAWSGKKLLSAPWLLGLVRAAGLLSEGGSLQFRIDHKGNKMLTTSPIPSDPTEEDGIRSVLKWIEVFRLAYEVAKLLGLNPTIPTNCSVSEAEYEQLSYAHSFLTKSAIPAAGIVMHVRNVTDEGVSLIKRIAAEGSTSGQLKLEQPMKFSVFGDTATVRFATEGHEARIKLVEPIPTDWPTQTNGSAKLSIAPMDSNGIPVLLGPSRMLEKPGDGGICELDEG